MGNASMENTTLVLTFIKTINTKSNNFAQNPKSIGRSEQKLLWFIEKEKLSTLSVDSFKKKLFTGEISRKSTSFISNVNSSHAVSHYVLI